MKVIEKWCNKCKYKEDCGSYEEYKHCVFDFVLKHRKVIIGISVIKEV